MSTKKKSTACKLCRRAGRKLFLKGDRCFTTKCAIIKRNYAPGVHGPKGNKRITPFGMLLHEKQKAKAYYGLMEKQFKNYFLDAVSKKGDTGEIFISLLERRLDSVVFRMGFAASRKHARQLISHRLCLINNKKVNIPSYQVHIGDEIKICDKAKEYQFFKDRSSLDAREITPSWLSIDRKNLSGKIVSMPQSDDLIIGEFDIKSIVEYYSK